MSSHRRIVTVRRETGWFGRAGFFINVSRWESCLLAWKILVHEIRAFILKARIGSRCTDLRVYNPIPWDSLLTMRFYWQSRLMLSISMLWWPQRIFVIGRKSRSPFFITVGFHRSHLFYVAPSRYFDVHPLDGIKLPYDRL